MYKKVPTTLNFVEREKETLNSGRITRYSKRASSFGRAPPPTPSLTARRPPTASPT